MMPDDANVVAIGLVLDQGAGCFGFEHAPYLIALMPTNTNVVGLAKVFADVILGFTSIRAHTAVVVLKRTAFPYHI